jgi:hypothetical protein
MRSLVQVVLAAYALFTLSNGLYLVVTDRWRQPWLWITQRRNFRTGSGPARVFGGGLVVWGVAIGAAAVAFGNPGLIGSYLEFGSLLLALISIAFLVAVWRAQVRE